ncbi:condensation domain-containing protein [Sphaerisporangium aureirubrum]|uniref:Condensation domain-containing protein n=1 Tax=Sphaerisporangium aureirubrum TaxID=1544736 RepID=A0ABW1NGN8_9ACTN
MAMVLPATAAEFGLWYQEQAAEPRGRYLCLAAAELCPGSQVSLRDAAGAMTAVRAGHPEALARFAVDEQGLLHKFLESPADSLPAEVLAFPAEWRRTDVVSHLAGLPTSLATGPLVHLAAQADHKGNATRLFVLAHHIVWDAHSEEIFWTEVDRRLTGPGAGDAGHRHPGFGPSVHRVATRDHAPLVTDLQRHLAISNGDRVWERLAAAARRAGVTPFAWTVGHLAAAAAAWSEPASVMAYIDVDLRPLAGTSQDTMGFHLSQLEIATVDRGTSGPAAAAAVHTAVMRRLAAAMRQEIRPGSEAAGHGGRPCKFYLRDIRYRRRLHHLRPIDIRLPVARNQLSVGVTVTDTSLEVTVTARRGTADSTGIARLAQLARRHLISAAAHGERAASDAAP